MKGELRKAINHKKSLYRKFHKQKTDENGNSYKKQRNKVTKLKRSAINSYFFERCSGGPKSKDFWPTIRPFLTNKGSNQQSEINLCENNVIISDQKQVCDIFNDFFVNVAKDIGTDSDTHSFEVIMPLELQSILMKQKQKKNRSTIHER